MIVEGLLEVELLVGELGEMGEVFIKVEGDEEEEGGEKLWIGVEGSVVEGVEWILIEGVDE